MKTTLCLIFISFLAACSSSSQKVVTPAEATSKEMMQQTEKRAKEPVGDSQTALLEKYYSIGNMEAETASFVTDMKDIFEGSVTESAEALGADKVALLTDTFARTVTAESVFENFKTHFSKNFEATHLSETIAWMESPVGKRIRAMEDFADSPEGEEAMMAYIQTLKENPPDSVRSEKIFTLFEEKGVKKIITNMMTGMMSSSERIVNRSLPEESRMTPEQLREAEEEMSQFVALSTEMGVVMLSMFMYKDATDEDLEKFFAFYNTDAGNWIANAELNAFIGMVESSFADVYRALYANK